MKEGLDINGIKKAIVDNKELIEDYKETEFNWYMRDSNFSEFGGTFEKALPEEYVGNLHKKLYVDFSEYGEAFKKYIEDTLSQGQSKKLTAIEFGGPGSRLFQGFSNGFFNKTVGVCLDDIRGTYDQLDDKQNNHEVISGNILDVNNKETEEKIFEALGTNKTDLIISRMMKPARDINKHPAILSRIIKKWYSLLNDNGIIFAQFEYFKEHNPSTEQKYDFEISPAATTDSEKIVSQWAKEVEKIFPGLIEIQLGRGIIRLHKNPGAPEELPTIEKFE